jgi:ABC-2 type transport system permease protein/lipopolysaccharide transport system permease protein
VPSKTSLATADLLEGLRRRWLWSALAFQDIRLRYRGSALGPIWLTLSTGVMIAAMGTIYSRLFGQNVATYLPYLSIGLVLWQYIASTIGDGCQTFLAAESIIQQVPMPFSLYVYRTVYRNLLVLAHNAVIIPIVLLAFRSSVDWRILWVVPGIFVLIVNSVWIGVFFGMLSARFRDVPPIVANFVQVVFFVTPIFWHAQTLGSLQRIVELNPFFAAVDVVRAPLMSQDPAPHSWAVLLIVTILGSIGTFAVFAKLRARIAYWI